MRTDARRIPALLRRGGRAPAPQGSSVPANALLDYATPSAPLLDYTGAFLLSYG